MATNKRFPRLRAKIRKSAAAATLALAAAVAATLPAGKLRASDWMPLLPDQDFYDFQLFAPPDLGNYNIYQAPSEGIFFNYDRLYWGITIPDQANVGTTPLDGSLIPIQPISPQTVVQLNNAGQDVIGGIIPFGTDVLSLDLNTSWMRTKMTWGNRYSGGWIYENRGIAISYFDTGTQVQSFTTISEFAAGSPEQEFEQTGESGESTIGGVANPIITTTITSTSPPPDHLISQSLTQKNETQIQSAGFAATVRRWFGSRQSGTWTTFSLGPRFIQLEDRFNLGYQSYQYAFNAGSGTTTTGNATGTGTAGQGGTGDVGSNVNQANGNSILQIGGVQTLTGTGEGTLLQRGDWETYTSNNMVGPEFGLLLEGKKGRWSWTAELKFTPAFNWQNNIYRGANFPDSLAADYLRSTLESASTFSVTQGSQGTSTEETVTAPPLYLQIYGAGQQNATNDAAHEFVFSPVGEWRFGAAFKVSQAISLRGSYTGMWLAGIARASTNTGYETVTRPVQTAQQQQDGTWVVEPRPARYTRIAPAKGGNEYVFANGIDFGVEFKY